MKELLKIAREAIESQLTGKELFVDNNIKKNFKEKGASFVTLTLNGTLRGCIGTLEANQELWKDVIQNSRYAAFEDSRFSSVDLKELSKIKIEVSVLTKPLKLEFKDSNDLLKKLDKQMGIILLKNGRRATFLPQVWEEVPEKVDFLNHLCIKAGLSKEAWKDDCEIFFYRVNKIKE